MAYTTGAVRVHVEQARKAVDSLMSALNMAEWDKGVDEDAEALRCALLELRPLIGPIALRLHDLS